ncbi:hypothetical protein [Streptomyces anthocyanicus]|uniref:hypothetical protein n=1 Tax=Streptomyces anthocyanicus TaxID=68174 RepID=UPI00339EA998|nr:hypothetical protein OHA15_37085 [Streptomyces anthocyanicus]WTE16462.1 hypothetical protein OH747_02155 [Streptomyces anthocyanicus]
MDRLLVDEPVEPARDVEAPAEGPAEPDALVETMDTEVRETGGIAARTGRAFHRVRAQARGVGAAADGEEPARMHAGTVEAVRAGGAKAAEAAEAAAAEAAVRRHFDDIRGRLSQHGRPRAPVAPRSCEEGPGCPPVG